LSYGTCDSWAPLNLSSMEKQYKSTAMTLLIFNGKIITYGL